MLIQIDDELWLDPAAVTSIYRGDGTVVPRSVVCVGHVKHVVTAQPDRVAAKIQKALSPTIVIPPDKLEYDRLRNTIQWAIDQLEELEPSPTITYVVDSLRRQLH